MNKEYSKSTTKTLQNSAKTCPNLTTFQQDISDILVVSLLPNLDRSHTQCMASSIYVEQKFVCKVQLIFKNVRRNKKIYTKCKSEKYLSQIQHSTIDLKMELFVKIVNCFKLSYFCKNIHFRYVTGSEFASDYNRSNVLYKQEKSYITVSWNSDFYYPAAILPVQSQQQKHLKH